LIDILFSFLKSLASFFKITETLCICHSEMAKISKRYGGLPWSTVILPGVRSGLPKTKSEDGKSRSDGFALPSSTF
jgi:hypothetical protein